ncbi:hypothetical protein I4U23_008325 [Adineta vaga]|nr:hypothetical protein I4U23_008325 [Adineta vaga]
MSDFFMIILFLINPNLIYAGIADSSNAVTTITWFWPVFGVCLSLILSIPCALAAMFLICHKNKHSNHSDASSISSDSSPSTMHTHQRSLCDHHRHLHHLYHASGFPSPPPPYASHEQPENVFSSSSLPPPYESHFPSDISTTATTVIHVEPNESILTESSDHTRTNTALNVSPTATHSSLQTFHV